MVSEKLQQVEEQLADANVQAGRFQTELKRVVTEVRLDWWLISAEFS